MFKIDIRIQAKWFPSFLALGFGLWASAAQAQEYRYRYVDLDQVPLPAGYLFFEPIVLNDSGAIYGNAYDSASFYPHVAVYKNGTITVLQPDTIGAVSSVNAGGTMAGSVLVDPVNFIVQSALFRGSQVELIPPQPGEFSNQVFDINDPSEALVASFTGSPDAPKAIYSLYNKGKNAILNFGPTITNPFFLHLNNQAIISGTIFGSHDRGFRFDPRSGRSIELAPLPTEPDAWALGINESSDVLGYSFVSSGRERIGTWNKQGNFKTYFTEGTPEVPTISNRLRFNDNNLIVITFVSSPSSDREKSYLVPKPGVRLNIADLVTNMPPNRNISFVDSLNNHGDMIGSSCINFSCNGTFLLERLDGSRAASSHININRHISGKKRHLPAKAASLLRRKLQSHKLKSGARIPQTSGRQKTLLNNEGQPIFK
ncbi:MAG TPA: hypothetical protein V6D19_02530 [Stenomitos sp.]